MRRWKLPDAFQASIAQRNGWRLVTRNSKDFNPSSHDFVLIPYKVWSISYTFCPDGRSGR
jgi:hypothetical protein